MTRWRMAGFGSFGPVEDYTDERSDFDTFDPRYYPFLANPHGGCPPENFKSLTSLAKRLKFLVFPCQLFESVQLYV